MLHHITIPQSRYRNPSTTARYLAYCKAHAIIPNTIHVDVGDGNKVDAHWIGASDAETVILYLHGGGYTQPANEGNMRYLTRLITDLNSQKGCRSVAVLVLAYTLAPEATHPAQLKQASAVLAHLVTNTGRKPSDIFVSGDSAGGNLGLALLSHLMHPHPEVPTVKLELPLAGTLLYSPWASFSTEFSSYANVTLDCLSPLALRKWSAMFLGKANKADQESDPGPISGDGYTEASKNAASWWDGLHRTVSAVFVSYGSYEVLACPIKDLEIQMKKGWTESGGEPNCVVFVEGSKEAHIAPIVDIMTPDAHIKSSSQNTIESWYKARLQL
jgi:acetyl esterase/lipase